MDLVKTIKKSKQDETKHALDKLTFIEKAEDKWFDDDVENPNKDSIDKSREIITKLGKVGIIPRRVSPTIEEGICLVYDFNDDDCYLEIYNNGEMGILVEDTKMKKIKLNIDLKNSNDAIKTIKRYCK